MKLILEVRKYRDDEEVRHLVFEKFPVSIGRGFDNDIILNDAYVSPHHLQIEYDGKICTVSDYSSHNGITINGAAPSGRRSPLHSGDTLGVGLMEIRVYKPEHPVPAAIPLVKDNPFFKWISAPLHVWACFLLTIAVTMGCAWLEVWTDETALALAMAVAVTTGVIILWATVWSVAGRLTHHKAHFKSHIALICLYLLMGTVAWYIQISIDFLTNENWFAQVTSYGINFVLLSLLLYGSFALATKLPRKRRTIGAAFFSFGVMAGVFIFTLVSAKSFNQQPLYPATLEPYLSRLASAQTLDRFMAGNEKLFRSDVFAKPEKMKPATPPKPAEKAASN